MPAPARRAAPKDGAIQIRTSAETKALINRAAQVRGQSLSDFVIQSARQAAENAILDQRVFLLEDKQWNELMDILDSPPAANERLRKTLAATRVWEK
jgi:uncharacterized protein (DUF1778 family)